MARVSVIGQESFAFHGCHPLERKTGGKFEVDVHIDTDFTKAVATDSIAEAVDYVQIMEIINTQMSLRCNLIETVAKNIIDALWEVFGEAIRIEVFVRKLQPPIMYMVNNVSVIIVEENQLNK